MKHAQNRIDDPWEVEITYWINKHGDDPDKARTFTVLRWMYHGDLRPLRAAIAQSPVLDEAILGCLATLIDEGRLTVKPLGRNRPKSPDKFSRDIAAVSLYEHEISAGKTSQDALSIVAERLGVSEDNVRKAVTRFRKNAK